MKYQGDKIMLSLFKVVLGSPGTPNRTLGLKWLLSWFSVFTCKCVPGVLRGVDMERGLYYLLTSVDPSILLKVNCLLLGAISLPSCILTTQVRRRFKQRYFPDKHLSKPYFFTLTCATFVSVSARLWRRDALCHHRLQFWSQWCGKAASLQGTYETQSYRDTMTFSTQRWVYWPLHFLPNQSALAFWTYRTKGWVGWFISTLSPTEQPISQTLQEELAAFPLQDFLWVISQPPTVATFNAAVKGFCVFCHMAQ